jgi:hypothetical protein
MKKHLLFVIIALVAAVTPVLAQEGTIAVYFSPNGVQSSRYAQYSDFLYEAYVTIYVEDVVRGASFALDIANAEVSLISETYPAGTVYVGDMLTGVDLGLVDPLYGYLGNPCVVGSATLLNNVYPAIPNVDFMILPTAGQAFPIYAAADSQTYPLLGMPSALGDTIANDDMTWSGVKNLFQ